MHGHVRRVLVLYMEGLVKCMCMQVLVTCMQAFVAVCRVV